MVIVDSHCHLNYPCFEKMGLENMIAQAREAGVHYMQTICTCDADFDAIHPMALAHDEIFCSYGIHPHNASQDIVGVEKIVEKASLPKVIGIGETGLDYFYNHAPKEEQIANFKRHISAARQLDMPLIIHTRDAEDDTIAVLDEALAEGPMKLLLHCFSSSPKLAQYAVEKGIYVSASGIITFKKSDLVREGFALVPPELLLVETDAPYLAPTPHRGKDNTPAYTRIVLQKLAEMKQLPMEEMARITTENFFKLFDKAKG